MSSLYLVQNAATTTGGPNAGVTTSATLFTMLQLQCAPGFAMRVVEWGVSFNASALAASFPCDLVDTNTVGATVTAFAAVDVSIVNPTVPAQSGTSSGTPFILSTSTSGYTSSAEGSVSVIRSFDSQQVEPIGGYFKQFPPGREPVIAAGNNLRVRVHGDGTTKVTCYVVVEV